MNIQGSVQYNWQKMVLNEGENHLGDGVVATITTERYGVDAVYALLKIKNTGTEKSKQIYDARVIDLTFPRPDKVYYHSLEGDWNNEKAYMPIDKVLGGGHHSEPKDGCSSDRYAFPFFDLTCGDKSVVCGVGWTGQWSADVFFGEGTYNLRIGHVDCNFYLEPGEEVQLASAFIVEGDKDVAATRRRFKRIIRDEFSPKKRLGDKFIMPISLQYFDRWANFRNKGYEWTDYFLSERGVREQIEMGERLGMHTCWIDASWFKNAFPHGVGNFTPDEGFPNGLRPLSDYAHAHGQQFLAWFEFERVLDGTEMAAKKEFLLSYGENNPVKLVDFGNDKAREYMENLVFGLIEDFKLDVFRQDFNMDPLAYWRANDVDCRTGITEIKHINGLYKFWDHLLERFPNIWIDNTAGGGRRIDIETLRRAAFPWRSDTNCSYQYAYSHDQRRRTSWNHNQLLGLCEYIPYHGGGSWSEKAYDIRSTATHGINCCFDVYNPEFDWEAGKKIIAEVKEMSEYWDGDFYPLTKAALGEHIWAAYQLVLENRGALYAFRPEQCFIETESIAFKALDKDTNYRLTFIDDNFARCEKTYSGKELLAGIPLTIPQTRGSLIIKYEKI